MDAKLKTKWLKALRGGKYQQTRGMLKRRIQGKDRYCCIGVLLDVAGMEVKGPTIGNDICRSLGLPGDFRAHLESMNDGVNEQRRHDFKEIADHISEHL